MLLRHPDTKVTVTEEQEEQMARLSAIFQQMTEEQASELSSLMQPE